MEKSQGKEVQPCMISSHPTEEYGVVSPLLPDSSRKEIVTILLDQSCKNTQKNPSDIWSSEEEEDDDDDDDDDVFETRGEETTSPQTGDLFSPKCVPVTHKFYGN